MKRLKRRQGVFETFWPYVRPYRWWMALALAILILDTLTDLASPWPIAQAMVRQAPLLLLDEPTVALDAQAEQIIVQALERLMVGRTTLVIAHRLSTIQRADLVLVLDKGRIVEAGTPAELFAARGHYYQLYTLQFQARELVSPSSPEEQPLVESLPPQADTNDDMVDAPTNPVRTMSLSRTEPCSSQSSGKLSAQSC